MSDKRACAIALILCAATIVGEPVLAACGAPFLITTINVDAGSYAYVVNPTVTIGTDGGGLDGSSITDRFTGSFWSVGTGNPLPGVGADNGTFAALGWMYVYPNYPAAVLTTWAADAGIDTCIDTMGPLGERCQLTLIQDVDLDTGAGLFALVGTPDHPTSGDFFLDNGGLDLTLATMPKLTITSTSGFGAGGIEIGVRGPRIEDLEAGVFATADPACQGDGVSFNGVVQGWNLYYREVERHAPPPDEFDVDGWTRSSFPTQPLGGEVTVPIECSRADNGLYLAWQLVADSGFVTPLLSDASTRVECTELLADPDRNRQAPRGRQAGPSRRR